MTGSSWKCIQWRREPKEAMLWVKYLQRHLDVFVSYGQLPKRKRRRGVCGKGIVREITPSHFELELSVRSATV